MVKRSRTVVLLALLAGALALATAGCGGDDGGAGEGTGATDAEGLSPLPPIQALPTSSCTDIEYEGEGDPQVTDRLRHGLAGILADADPADRRGGPPDARLVRMEGGRGQRRLPVVRRLDGTGRQVGSGQVQPERERLRREPVAPGRNRHVQLGLRRGRAAGAEPGAGWKPRHGLAGEHVRLPHRRRAGVRRRRARSVLPDGRAQLRPCGRTRRLPGRGPRPVHAGAGDDEALHPQRPRGLRAGRRHERQGRGRAPRNRGRRLRSLGSEGVELRGADAERGSERRGWSLPRRPHR